MVYIYIKNNIKFVIYAIYEIGSNHRCEINVWN